MGVLPACSGENQEKSSNGQNAATSSDDSGGTIHSFSEDERRQGQREAEAWQAEVDADTRTESMAGLSREALVTLQSETQRRLRELEVKRYQATRFARHLSSNIHIHNASLSWPTSAPDSKPTIEVQVTNNLDRDIYRIYFSAHLATSASDEFRLPGSVYCDIPDGLHAGENTVLIFTPAPPEHWAEALQGSENIEVELTPIRIDNKDGYSIFEEPLTEEEEQELESLKPKLDQIQRAFNNLRTQ